MTTKYFESLPEPPTKVSATTVLKRLIDGMGFRYELATRDITEDEASFRPVPSSMSIHEVNVHIFHLCRGTAKSLDVSLSKQYDLGSHQEIRNVVLEIINSISLGLDDMSDDELSQKKIFLKRTNTSYPFWYLLNGFIADALSHIGQINSWRRMAGNPVDRISPFTGEPY